MRRLTSIDEMAAGTGGGSRFRIRSKPIRTVLGWQAAATVVLSLVAGFLAGFHGALSAALGGAVSLTAGLGFAWVASASKATSVEGALLGALRAEAVKVGLIVLLLWLVFEFYHDVVALALIGAFTVTVLIFAMAFFVREV